MTHAQVSPCYPADVCPTTTVPAPAPVVRLAQTGGDSVSLVFVGFALLMIGLVVLVAIRRKLTVG